MWASSGYWATVSFLGLDADWPQGPVDNLNLKFSVPNCAKGKVENFREMPSTNVLDTCSDQLRWRGGGREEGEQGGHFVYIYCFSTAHPFTSNT